MFDKEKLSSLFAVVVVVVSRWMFIVNQAKSGTNTHLAIASDIANKEYPLLTIKETINNRGTIGFNKNDLLLIKGGGSMPSIMTNRAETAPMKTSIVENNGENLTEFQNNQDGCAFGCIKPSKNVNPFES